jgi:hypothetical protein
MSSSIKVGRQRDFAAGVHLSEIQNLIPAPPPPLHTLQMSVFRFRDSLIRKVCTTVGTFTSVFKDSKSLGSNKRVEIKVFLIFCLLMEGSGSRQIIPDPGVPKTYGSSGSGTLVQTHQLFYVLDLSFG